MIVGGMAFNNKSHSYSTPSDVGFLEVGKSSWQLRCCADWCWLDTNFYSDRTWPQFIKVGCIYIFTIYIFTIYYIYIFIMIAKFFSWKVGKLGSWLCQLAFPKFPLLCQGITRQQSPITANLLGGPGQRWQGIPASHRWVPGERIRPRGWLHMSVNSRELWINQKMISHFSGQLCCGCLCCKATRLSDKDTWSMSFFLHSCLFGDRCLIEISFSNWEGWDPWKFDRMVKSCESL